MPKLKSEFTPEGWLAERERAKARYRESDSLKEKARERSRARYAEKREEILAKSKTPAEAEKRRQRQRVYYAANKEKCDAKSAKYRRLKRSGFTEELTAKLLDASGGHCSLCGRQFSRNVRMCADHCHATKRPRGLLCHECNTIEGTIRKIGIDPLTFGQRLHYYLAIPPADLVT